MLELLIPHRYLPISNASPASPCSRCTPTELFGKMQESCAPPGKHHRDNIEQVVLGVTETTLSRWFWVGDHIEQVLLRFWASQK